MFKPFFQRLHTLFAFKSRGLHVIDNAVYLVGRPRLLLGGARRWRGGVALRHGVRMVVHGLGERQGGVFFSRSNSMMGEYDCLQGAGWLSDFSPVRSGCACVHGCERENGQARAFSAALEGYSACSCVESKGGRRTFSLSALASRHALGRDEGHCIVASAAAILYMFSENLCYQRTSAIHFRPLSRIKCENVRPIRGKSATFLKLSNAIV